MNSAGVAGSNIRQCLARLFHGSLYNLPIRTLNNCFLLGVEKEKSTVHRSHCTTTPKTTDRWYNEVYLSVLPALKGRTRDQVARVGPVERLPKDRKELGEHKRRTRNIQLATLMPE